MTNLRCLLLSVFGFLLFIGSCAQTINENPVVFVASTPADEEIRKYLQIPQSRLIDFMRWELILSDPKSFVLNIHYGEGQPNTLGFKNGGTRASLTGTYEFTTRHDHHVLKLTNGKTRETLYLIRVNENLLHLLTHDEKLMVGNGGWSYSLNRKTPVASDQLKSIPGLRNHKFREVIFEGRTPCQEVSNEYSFNAPGECFKLKWKLTLLRSPYTKEPTTYNLSRTLERSNVLTGKWRVVATDNPDVTYIELDPDKPEKTMRLLAGDENVLFFVDKENKLFYGNSDFSYTMNRVN